MHYVEFAVTSNFSFLRGASHPEELVAQAAHIGLTGIGLCDRNSVAGVVRAHQAKREQNLALRFHPGARLVFADGTPDILVYPRHRAGWGLLTRLLTLGNLRARKGECILHLDDLLAHSNGLELVVFPSPHVRGEGSIIHDIKTLLFNLREAAPGSARIAASMLYRGRDRARLTQLKALAHESDVPLMAINDVHFHHPERRQLADILTCIREKITIDHAGRKLMANAEHYLKPPQEMARLFREAPEAINETLRLSAALSFSLDELRYEYPDEQIEGFNNPQEALTHLTNEGAKQRYPHGVPEKIRATIAHELALIAQLQYAPYFLTVYDIVRFARAQGILCQGRGSAANSAVCFCLGITEVDPDRADLLFERFISPERNEPPDIDVDFEHERREEVIQYIYQKYGRERAGIAATVISYRGRLAIREVGKVFGLSADTIGALSSSIWGGGGGATSMDAVISAGLDPQSPRMRQITSLAAEINGFPRHLSQHVGGFVITRSRLDEVVPIANAAMEERTFIEWDKDDLDALGILKIDILGLGMLSCLRRGLNLLEQNYASSLARVTTLHPPSQGQGKVFGKKQKLTLASIPAEDPAVYRMLQRADSLGVFQVESRAQMTMLPRLRPENFYDLVIEVAIVRPGPIQGNMVHPYLRRRRGLELVSYPSKELEAVLAKTLGVPLFQEQAMKIAIVAAGFTPAEADRLRRAMATFKRVGTIGTFQRKMVDGMLAKGYARTFAEQCFQQIEGFGEYGFPESHAASFALLVYASAWLKCHYPDVFATALLNAQPLGFYAPAQIIRDAREHGVEVRSPDINYSQWNSTLEPGLRAADGLHEWHRDMHEDVWTTHAIRLGLREIKGFSEKDAKLVVEKRNASTLSKGERETYDSIRDVWLRTGLPVHVLERLAEADAFNSLGLTRREALWGVKALGRVGDCEDDLPLFVASSSLPLRGSLRAENARAGSCSAIDSQRLDTTPTLPRKQSGQIELTLPAKREQSPCEIAREPEVFLPPMPLAEEMVNDYRFLHLSLRAHPAQFLRDKLSQRGILRNEALRTIKPNTRVRVSGLVTCRQRPGSANGAVFMTIEDESVIANVVIWPKVFERTRRIILGARYVIVSGHVQKESDVIHVVAETLEDMTPLLAQLTGHAADLNVTAHGSAHVPTRAG